MAKLFNSMVKRIFKNLYFLTFLNGFLVASLFYFKMEANYEQELFTAIQSNIDSRVNLKDNQDSIAVMVMHACNTLLSNRATVFGGQTLDGFKVDLNPTSIDLMTAKGACGSYSMVLARILENYHFPVRIAQMKAKGIYAAHNVVEVQTNNGWVVLDPLFNVYFRKPGVSGLASFDDVKNNWPYYSKQLPAGYNRNYDYEGVRYSNWGKIPVILPTIKKVLDLFLGKNKADNICMRMYFLRMYDFYFYMILILFVPLFLFTLKRLIKTRLFPQQNIPFTYHNIVRYIRIRFEGRRAALEAQKNTQNA
jgi:hypothetical protein